MEKAPDAEKVIVELSSDASQNCEKKTRQIMENEVSSWKYGLKIQFFCTKP